MLAEIAGNEDGAAAAEDDSGALIDCRRWARLSITKPPDEFNSDTKIRWNPDW